MIWISGLIIQRSKQCTTTAISKMHLCISKLFSYLLSEFQLLNISFYVHKFDFSKGYKKPMACFYQSSKLNFSINYKHKLKYSTDFNNVRNPSNKVTISTLQCTVKCCEGKYLTPDFSSPVFVSKHFQVYLKIK